MGALLVDLVEDAIARCGTDADSPQEAAFSHDVDLGDTGSQSHRIVVRDATDARAHFDLAGAFQRLGDDQLGDGDVLPGRGRVLADPGLLEAELVGQNEHVQVFVKGLRVSSMGWVAWHCEQSKLHSRGSFRRVSSAPQAGYLQGSRCAALVCLLPRL